MRRALTEVRLAGVAALLPVRVEGPSMAPALHAGDLCLLLRGGPVRPGDVVAVHRPDRPDHPLLVKRAVQQVPGGWRVLGDALAASTDSRHFGPVPDAAVLGRVVLRYWPPRRRRQQEGRGASQEGRGTGPAASSS